jgi:hypothetical protein
MRLGWALLVVTWAQLAYADVSVTVYNQNLGLVTETRSFDLATGMQHLTMTDVAAGMVPTSVRIGFSGHDVDLYEQNYHYDLVNNQAILQRYIDHPVRLVGKEDRVYEGVLLSASGTYVLQTDQGLKLVSPSEVQHIDLERLPEGFYTRPTLDWLVGTDRGGAVDAEVSYLTNGIGWHAEYVAQLNEDDTRLELSGWASIDNQSGATYRDARLKLIAGDIHRPPVPRPEMFSEGVVMAQAMPRASAGFDERSFFEYHLYDLPRRTTIANRETKQIALFDPAGAGVTKKYKYLPYKKADKISVVVEFENSEANGLGMPLPAGLVRVTKADIDGSKQLLGEDRIDHTPKDEDITLDVGDAFDLVPELSIVDRRKISKYVSESDVKITLRNHKEEAVTIEVEQKASRWQTWRLTAASHAYDRMDAETFRFSPEVPADGEVEITYTIRTGP